VPDGRSEPTAFSGRDEPLAPAGPAESEPPPETYAAIREGVRLFNAGMFFEAHEVLEDKWRRSSGEMKRFLKGLIHAAVAFYQYGRQNAFGARSKYHSTHYYLAPFAPEYAGVDVSALLSDMDHYFQTLLESTEGAPQWRPTQPPQIRIRSINS